VYFALPPPALHLVSLGQMEGDLCGAVDLLIRATHPLHDVWMVARPYIATFNATDWPDDAHAEDRRALVGDDMRLVVIINSAARRILGEVAFALAAQPTPLARHPFPSLSVTSGGYLRGHPLASALRSDLPSSLFRLCAMCDLGACPPLPLLPGILQPTTSRRLQRLRVRRTVALALSVRPALFSRWGTLSSPFAVHAVFSFLSARCVFSSQHNCFVCAWCRPLVAWVRGGGGVWILRWPLVVTSPSSLFRLCAMCDLGACPPLPALLPGILQLATSRRTPAAAGTSHRGFGGFHVASQSVSPRSPLHVPPPASAAPPPHSPRPLACVV
jgi:hypothetical protein